MSLPCEEDGVPSLHSPVHWLKPLTRRGLIYSKRLSRQLHPGLGSSPPQPTLLPIIFHLPLCMPNLMILRCILLLFRVPLGRPLLIHLHFGAGDAKESIWIFALSGALCLTLGKLQWSLKNRNHSKGEVQHLPTIETSVNLSRSHLGRASWAVAASLGSLV